LRKKETEKHKIFCNDGRRVNVQRMMRGERLFMFFIGIHVGITENKMWKNFFRYNVHKKGDKKFFEMQRA